MDHILYLEDQEFAGPFMKMKPGTEVTLTVKAVVGQSGSVPNFEAETDSSGETEPVMRRKPFVHMIIKSINGSAGGKKVMAEQTDQELEREAQRVIQGVGPDDEFDPDAHEQNAHRFLMGVDDDDEEQPRRRAR